MKNEQTHQNCLFVHFSQLQREFLVASVPNYHIRQNLHATESEANEVTWIDL